MALTKEQWYSKIKGLVQKWVSEDAGSSAILNGIASAMSEQQSIYENHKNETFIDDGSLDYVSQHGYERSIEKLADESLSSYRERVKTIVNKSNNPAIKQIVDALLIRGKCTIIENYAASNYLNRSSFLNRNIIDYEVLYNAFTILIDYQVPEPTSFLNGGAFLNREFLQGSNTSSEKVFSSVIEAVNKNKAFGIVYRLIERANP